MGGKPFKVKLKHIHLKDGFEETLQALSKPERIRLTYYRMLLDKKVSAELILDVSESIQEAMGSTLQGYRSEDRQSCDFVVGLRSIEGTCMSLIGGWRHNGATTISWQSSAEVYKNFHAEKALVSYFLEHEVLLKTSVISFAGRTFDTPIKNSEEYISFMRVLRSGL